MHELDLILTLAGGLGAALVLGYVTQRLGMSPIVGYLLAGIVVGPATPGFTANRELAEQLAEIGVILLMFGVGLQFHVRELLAQRGVAIPGAVIQSLVATILGALLVVSLGWGWTAGIVYGLSLSVASTVVLVRVLSDNRDLQTPTGHVAVAWLVMEDIFTVFILVLLPALAGSGGDDAGRLAQSFALALVKIGLLVAFAALIGDRLIPWLLGRVAATRSRELFTLSVLAFALGIAVLSAQAFDVSIALGAFLAGMVVGRSEFSLRAASEALPMRDAFAVLFFVSIGMLFDPGSLLNFPAVVGLSLLVVLLGKPLAAFGITAALGYPSRVALAVAAALAQIGEFSFILATAANQLGLLPDDAIDVLVVTSIVTISLNPLVYRTVDPLNGWLSRREGAARLVNGRRASRLGGATVPARDERDPRNRAIIVGYGPVGRTLASLLRQQGIDAAVIEMNLATVRALRESGVEAFYGDASLRATLDQVGVDRAGALVISVAGLTAVEELIRSVRDINPRIHILARATYLAEIPALREAGADRVFAAEGEVALAMAESILSDLGATPEQIDRQRASVHEELFSDVNRPS